MLYLIYFRPDQTCLNRAATLNNSKSQQSNQEQEYIINPDGKAVKVRITLLENSCKLARFFDYCDANDRYKFGSAADIKCDDGSQDGFRFLSGNTGFSGECTLNFPAKIIFVRVQYSGSPCRYEVKYE